MGMDQLMKFRTVLLRTIAQAWADPSFKHRLLNEDPAKVIDEEFGFPWPWPACELKVREPSRYVWLEDRWFWSPVDGPEDLIMYMPLDPDLLGVALEHRAQALADFYRARPALFDDDWGKHDDPNVQDGPRSPAMTAENRGVAGRGSGPPDGGFIPRGKDFTDFKVVLLEAMARAWADPVFRQKLETDCAKALRAIKDYRVPWKLVFSVKSDTKAHWNPPRGKVQSFWHLPTKDVLHLNLPEGPGDLRVQPVALAAYNAMGAKYPFSCCLRDTP